MYAIGETDRVLTTKTQGKGLAKDTDKAHFQKVHLCADKTAKPQPEHTLEEKECLATFASIGGCEVWTLWDSGSTTMGRTPAFAQVADIQVFPLTNPHLLQLGTVGSWATMNYSVDIRLEALGIINDTYVDIVNFDHYDMIIGTPFMHRNKVILDFENKQVIINGTPTPAVKEVEHCKQKGKSRELGLTEEDYPQLRQQWHDEFIDILGGTRDQLPPWREVNHEIHLIDDNKQYRYHLLRVPHSLHDQFHEKINRYVNAGWWEPQSVSQAAPMLCLNK
ncbi:hypothetical protein L208DRAFT_1316812, partial [Tricholoma matsutake]